MLSLIMDLESRGPAKQWTENSVTVGQKNLSSLVFHEYCHSNVKLTNTAAVSPAAIPTCVAKPAPNKQDSSGLSQKMRHVSTCQIQDRGDTKIPTFPSHPGGPPHFLEFLLGYLWIGPLMRVTDDQVVYMQGPKMIIRLSVSSQARHCTTQDHQTGRRTARMRRMSRDSAFLSPRPKAAAWRSKHFYYCVHQNKKGEEEQGTRWSICSKAVAKFERIPGLTG